MSKTQNNPKKLKKKYDFKIKKLKKYSYISVPNRETDVVVILVDTNPMCW